MAQEHFDRLTALDASFLEQEGPTSHMHVGAVATFENPAPVFDDFLDTIRGRLHLVPRYRQKLALPPMRTGRPVWVDDPNFNIEYHVRRTALPPPGSQEQLLLLASRLFSQQLDRSKPLWEMWIIEGLENDSWALINKTHHAMIDGVSGVDLATVIFDLSPEGTKIDHPAEPWQAASEPGDRDLLASGALGIARTAID
ncbi:MAG: wax ester/triacylglycerol synthase domain-containing protein, partial [Actinomycetes bacterium]